jgi:hypothetical protein
MKIIAISGFKRSGKDTTAEIMVNDYGFMRVAFADVLKDMVAKEYGIPREHCDDPKFKEAPIVHLPVTPKDDFSRMLCNFMVREFRDLSGNMPMEAYNDPSGAFLGVMGRHAAQLYWTPRALCILKGSSNRAVTSQFWTEQTINLINNEIHKAPSLPTGFVISDLRYRSEVEQLRQAFGKDLTTIRINRSINLSSDPSEHDLNDYKFDYVIDNTGTIEDLKLNIQEILSGNQFKKS